MKTTRYVGKSARNPEKAVRGQVSRSLDYQCTPRVRCEYYGTFRLDLGGPHAPHLANGELVDCIGQHLT